MINKVKFFTTAVICYDYDDVDLIMTTTSVSDKSLIKIIELILIVMSRHKMPHNNRVSGSIALRTNDMWSKTIGHNPYANQSEALTQDDKNADNNSSIAANHLMLLAKMSNLSGVESRGGCKKCGALGHMTFQCRNASSGIITSHGKVNDDDDSSSSSDLNDDMDERDKSQVTKHTTSITRRDDVSIVVTANNIEGGDKATAKRTRPRSESEEDSQKHRHRKRKHSKKRKDKHKHKKEEKHKKHHSN